MKLTSSFSHRMLLLATLTPFLLLTTLVMFPSGPAVEARPGSFTLLAPTSKALAVTPMPRAATGTIALAVTGAPRTAWVGVEWQDNNGYWHAVDGWQGGLDQTGQTQWWVNKEDMGNGAAFRWVVYDRPGGNLWATSAAFQLPSSEGLSVWSTITGPTATVAAATAPAATAVAAHPAIYLVKPGDTLFLIALQFQTTVSDLQLANGLTSAWIYPGQKLILSGAPVSQNSPANSPAPTPLRTDPIPRGVYLVQPGDTLFRIALRAGTTISALQSANHWYGTWIWAGQTLIIP
jgi:LysM repeat protein